MARLVLLTNDDGFAAEGLEALAAVFEHDHEVWVVAPDAERSACSHSLTIQRPVRGERKGARRFAADGTPADCVNLAVSKLLPRRPDLVISGINRGANLGEDVFYSGTVAGAREAVLLGLPAIAVSLAVRSGAADFGHAALFAEQLARLVFEHGLPAHTLLNVNVPPGAPRGTVLARQGQRHASEDSPAAWADLQGIEGDHLSDGTAVRNGFIALTPLQTDQTHHAMFAGLRAWEQRLRQPGSVATRPR
ncbi:MAG: 5'/3'-nucleotidase SurE [Vicinamibacteria bacterium]|nr:5'/3'-nucleotidase SurE [Vicinamibacteria bacterium]